MKYFLICTLLYLTASTIDGFVWAGFTPRITLLIQQTFVDVLNLRQSFSESSDRFKQHRLVIGKGYDHNEFDCLMLYQKYWDALKTTKVDQKGVLRVGMEIPFLKRYRYSPEETNKIIVREDFKRLWQLMKHDTMFEDIRQFVIRVPKGVGREYFLQYLLYELRQKPDALKAGVLYSRAFNRNIDCSDNKRRTSKSKNGGIMHKSIHSDGKVPIEYFLFNSEGVKRLTDIEEIIQVTSATKAWWLMDEGGHDSPFLPFAECRVVYSLKPRDEMDDSKIPLLNLPVAVQLGLPPWDYGSTADHEDTDDDETSVKINTVLPEDIKNDHHSHHHNRLFHSRQLVGHASVATPGNAATPGSVTTPGNAATPGSVTTPGNGASPGTDHMDGLSDELKLLLQECFPSFNNPDDIANIKLAADLWGAAPRKLFVRRTRDELREAKNTILKAIEDGAVTLADYLRARSTLTEQDDDDPVLKLMTPLVDRTSYRILRNDANSPYIKRKIVDRMVRFEGKLLSDTVKQSSNKLSDLSDHLDLDL